MYAKEQDDPHGDKVLSLSDLLIKCGIDCTIDHYHANENIPNWSFWVQSQIEFFLAAKDGYILLICSEKMFELLNYTTDNIRIKMVHAHIDQLTLKIFLEGYTVKFLPVVIDEYQKNVIPLCLQGTTTFVFPYTHLINDTNDTDHQSILELPEFLSVRNLVATLSKQQEIPRPTNECGKLMVSVCHA